MKRCLQLYSIFNTSITLIAILATALGFLRDISSSIRESFVLGKISLLMSIVMLSTVLPGFVLVNCTFAQIFETRLRRLIVKASPRNLWFRSLVLSRDFLHSVFLVSDTLNQLSEVLQLTYVLHHE